MTTTTAPSKRYFTDAARAAALAARQAKALLPKGDGVEVFVVRATPGRFSWEIRRFGGVVVEQGGATFPTLAEALTAGRRALARRGGRRDAGVERGQFACNHATAAGLPADLRQSTR